MHNHIIRDFVSQTNLSFFKGEVPRKGDIVLVYRAGEQVRYICDCVEWEVHSCSKAIVIVRPL